MRRKNPSTIERPDGAALGPGSTHGPAETVERRPDRLGPKPSTTTAAREFTEYGVSRTANIGVRPNAAHRRR